MQQREILVRKLTRDLERTGRDQARIEQAIGDLERVLKPDDLDPAWSEDWCQWIDGELKWSLERVLDQAVEADEFEQAQVLASRLRGLD
jgi:uncharacterized coiled-coil DUF342 family protein